MLLLCSCYWWCLGCSCSWLTSLFCGYFCSFGPHLLDSWICCTVPLHVRIDAGLCCGASSCLFGLFFLGTCCCCCWILVLVFLGGYFWVWTPDIGNSSCPKRTRRVSRLSTLHSPQENRVRICQTIPKVWFFMVRLQDWSSVSNHSMAKTIATTKQHQEKHIRTKMFGHHKMSVSETFDKSRCLWEKRNAMLGYRNTCPSNWQT